jgi:F-type H+-transporting ATPase subunit b
MIELNITFFIQLVNFLIVLFVLNLILYRPIRGIIKKRAEIMAARLDEIERFTAQASDRMTAYEQELDNARQQAQDLRMQMKEEGYAEEKKLVEAASTEAGSILKAAREKIASEKKSAIAALKAQVDKFAQMAAEKILGQA